MAKSTIVWLDAEYENVAAECPSCGTLNTYNRASDIGHLDPILNQRVLCNNDNCGAPFHIVGDLINPGYEKLLLDSWDLLRAKNYRQAVLSATTAYELFFAHFLRVELVYRPCNRDDSATEDDVEWLNKSSALLLKSTKRQTFESMRRLFLRATVNGVRPATRAEATDYIDRLPNKPEKVANVEIEGVSDDRLRALLLRVSNATIASLRNQIVHKAAYCPSLDEAKPAVEDAFEAVFSLGDVYRLGDDNYHLNEPVSDIN